MYGLQKQTLHELPEVNSEDELVVRFQTRTLLPSPFSKIHSDVKKSLLKALGRMRKVNFGINSKILFLKKQNHP